EPREPTARPVARPAARRARLRRVLPQRDRVRRGYGGGGPPLGCLPRGVLPDPLPVGVRPVNRLGRGTPAGGLAPVLARGHTAARRFRSALRRRFRPAPGARRPDPSLLRALRRPRRLPGPVRRQLRAAETWPLPAD